jgi:hypothetical protein
MRRDEFAEVVSVAGDRSMDVQVYVGGFLLDVDSVEVMEDRGAIVLRVPANDLRDVIGHILTRVRWWRGSLPGGLDDSDDHSRFLNEGKWTSS